MLKDRGIRSCQSSLLHHLEHVLADEGRRFRHSDACIFESLDLAGSVALAFLYNSSSVTHTPLGRGSEASNESNDWFLLGVVLANPLGSHFLVLSSDFSDDDDAFGFGVDHELLEDVDEVGSVEWVSADAHNSALAKTSLGGLVNSLISEGSRSTNDADLARSMNVAGHNANFALLRLDDAGAVGSDDSSPVLSPQCMFHSNHVLLGNTCVKSKVPSVMTTQRSSSASRASMMALAAPGGGT